MDEDAGSKGRGVQRHLAFWLFCQYQARDLSRRASAETVLMSSIQVAGLYACWMAGTPGMLSK